MANMQLPADLSLALQREETRQVVAEHADTIPPEQLRRMPPGELWDDTAVILAKRI